MMIAPSKKECLKAAAKKWLGSLLCMSVLAVLFGALAYVGGAELDDDRAPEAVRQQRAAILDGRQ